jgi:hypothetical protein
MLRPHSVGQGPGQLVQGLFATLLHGRGWLEPFFGWHNDEHHHSGIALFTPGDVFFGKAPHAAAGTPRREAPTTDTATLPCRILVTAVSRALTTSDLLRLVAH